MFPLWDGPCEGCNHEVEESDDEESDEELHYKLSCPKCDYKGCHECMPLGRGSSCEGCIDPETGE